MNEKQLDDEREAQRLSDAIQRQIIGVATANNWQAAPSVAVHALLEIAGVALAALVAADSAKLPGASRLLDGVRAHVEQAAKLGPPPDARCH